MKTLFSLALPLCLAALLCAPAQTQASGPSFNSEPYVDPNPPAAPAPAPASVGGPSSAPSLHGQTENFGQSFAAPEQTQGFSGQNASAPASAPAVLVEKEPAWVFCAWKMSKTVNPEQRDVTKPGYQKMTVTVRYNNRSDDRMLLAVSDKTLTVTGTAKSAAGPVTFTIRTESAKKNTFKNPIGPGSRYGLRYTIVLDEEHVTFDGPISWQEFNESLPFYWYEYRYAHTYTAYSENY